VVFVIALTLHCISQASAIAIAVAYISIGAYDWSDTFLHVTTHLEQGLTVDSVIAATASTGLYVLRHVYMYYGLSKWLVQWDRKLFTL
jgi:hypothetical protein